MADQADTFWRRAGRLLNAGQSRSLLLTGNIHDLFRCEARERDVVCYLPLTETLQETWARSSAIVLVYELTGSIRFADPQGRAQFKRAWCRWRSGMSPEDQAIERMYSDAPEEDVGAEFERHIRAAYGKPAMALALLKQFCLVSREYDEQDKRLLRPNLIILIENAEFLIPETGQANLAELHRVSLVQDWISDPEFSASGDAVLFIAESSSLLHRRIARLPHLLEVEVEIPTLNERRDFIRWFNATLPKGKKLKLWGSQMELAHLTAGLSLHALQQLLKGAVHQRGTMQPEDVVQKVESFIKSQLGEDIVEFKLPHHTLKDVVGFSNLKAFLKRELIPRFKASGPESLPGCAVSGPIGSGKTFIFEAVASELDMVVLVLKGIRSQWYGQTDVILERLKRVLTALSKVLIFVDEADTQFGGVGAETHATERRLTGKIQAMMSDPRSRGKVLWLLMTARIHLLSPDIRRPGRVGDLIIPVLDPRGDDRRAFIDWMLKPVISKRLSSEHYARVEAATEGYFAASYAALRSELKARAAGGKLSVEQVVGITEDLIPPAIGLTRRYQTLQALVNCTRRSLLPEPEAGSEERERWMHEIRVLERQGIG